MLEVRDLWFRYGRRGPWVVRAAELTMRRGEVVGIRGPSGTGKTTFARLLSGYLPADRGTVAVGGQPVDGPGVRPVQLVFQHPELAVNPRWRLREILLEGGPVDPELLEALSISDSWLARYPNELSGGELQRVAVARALLARPGYLVADEISAMLDAITQAQIWHLLLDRVRSGELGVVAISHDAQLLDLVADRVLEWPGLEAGQPAGAVRPTAGAGRS